MAMFDMLNNSEQGPGIVATLSGTTPATSLIADMQGWQAITWYVATGTVTDAGTTAGIVFEVQESDDTVGANFTAVADGDLIGTEAAISITSDASDDVPIGGIGYRGEKRYVRIVATGSTGTNATIGVTSIKHKGADMKSVSLDVGTAAT